MNTTIINTTFLAREGTPLNMWLLVVVFAAVFLFISFAIKDRDKEYAAVTSAISAVAFLLASLTSATLYDYGAVIVVVNNAMTTVPVHQPLSSWMLTMFMVVLTGVAIVTFIHAYANLSQGELKQKPTELNIPQRNIGKIK